MHTCELIRTVTSGQLTIQLAIEASSGPCSSCLDAADYATRCALILIQDDDSPQEIAERIMETLSTVNSVKVTDEVCVGCMMRRLEESME
jgi:hypothetical protein